MRFAERICQHDSEALPLVKRKFSKYGYTIYSFGIELAPQLHASLQKLQDDTSKIVRYRPDLVAVHPQKGSILLEIKSEKSGNPNFAVEFDAWDAARLWNQDARKVLYVFADLLYRIVYACWPEEIRPQKIYVPRTEDIQRIIAICPDVEIVSISKIRGSGTAFFLVPKKTLYQLEIFLQNNCHGRYGVYAQNRRNFN